MEILLGISLVISLLLTLIVLPKWIRKSNQVGLLWQDMNKYGKPKNVASSGGIVVVMSFLFGVLSYIAIRTFVFGSINGITNQILALISVILILAIVGLTDDLLGWKHGGLSSRFRILLAVVSSIPLVVINAGTHLINLPFFGEVSLGLIYPLVLIPIGITGATSVYNFLAGFNGLEAGQGIIILSFLSFISYRTGNSWLAMIGLCMVFSLIGFYYYNKCPAKVFPGDIMTWSIGALIAGMAILGNFEKIAVFIFIPYIMEFFLKLRGKLKKYSFAKPNKDNSLELRYDKIYGLTHLGVWLLKKVKNKVYEKEVVYLIFLFQIFICLLALLIFRQGIFI
jgi:UDP-N-acetylglucosamine--dolichyl-phosphate N-acetylglucosaminephosphotransferase